MATTTSITTTYAGASAGEYIGAALLSGNTLQNDGISIKQNIKYKEVIKKLATGASLIQDGTCDFTPTSSVTTTERVIEPEEFQVNLKLCKKDFRSDWEAIEMGMSVYDDLPPSFSAFLISHVLEQVAAANESNIWSGTNATNGEYGGFVELMTADADVIDVTGTTVTSSNVVVELGKIVDAIPSALYGKEGLRIYVAQNIYRAYVRSLGGFVATIGGAGVNDQGNNQSLSGLVFDGVQLFLANGLADNKAIAAEKDNLWFGTGLLNDAQTVKVLDQEDVDGSQNVNIVVRYTASVQYGIGAECVLYS